MIEPAEEPEIFLLKIMSMKPDLETTILCLWMSCLPTKLDRFVLSQCEILCRQHVAIAFAKIVWLEHSGAMFYRMVLLVLSIKNILLPIKHRGMMKCYTSVICTYMLPSWRFVTTEDHYCSYKLRFLTIQL